jgi:acyl-CoA synthetase (NDP forming)
LIEKAKRKGRHLLEPEALTLLGASGISVPGHVLVRGRDEAVDAAKSLGWPVVMKIVSPDILHKTDTGGVLLNLQNEREVREAFARLSSLEGLSHRVEGILVCPFQAHDVEVSVGMVRDTQFGPVITFGLGGIWIEVLQDMAYGIAPLSYEEAEDMVQSIRAHSILAGVRGRNPADGRALCELLVTLSRMVFEETAIQEIDLNPVFPLEKGYFIADARIILS